MSKKLLSIILFLSLSLFLVMPVHAADPGNFVKETDIYPNDLDYRNSLVDWYGYNLDFDIIKDTAGGLDPTATNIYLRLNGVNQFNLTTWDKLYPDDPGDFQYKLRITESQKTAIKRVLFDRVAGDILNSQSFLGIYPRNYSVNFNPWAFYVRIYFTGFLDINFGSIYISDNLNQENSGVLSTFQKGIWVKDRQDETITNFVLDDQTTQPFRTGNLTPSTDFQQRAVYNFSNRITGIKSIDLFFQISANAYDPNPEILYFINEIGFFASDQVILPDLNVDTDFQIYAPTTCGAIDIACVSRNLIGELSNNIYKRFGAETIASGVMDIYDTIFYPVYMIDNSAWQNGVISIYGIVVLGVLYLLLKRNI